MIEVLLIALLSLGFRVFDLLSLPIYVDEATYLSWALDIWDQRTRAALMIPIVVDGKQPLFMWLAGGASYLFPDPLLAGRVVSALAGVLSAVGIYLVGRWLMGRRVGLLAGLLYAVVPFNLFYDRLALVEGLLNAEAVWALALAVFIMGKERDARCAVLGGAGLGLALGAALWTKMPALFILPFPLLCALLLSKRGRVMVPARGFAVAGAIVAVAATLLFLAPHAGSLWDKAQGFTEPPQVFLTYLPGRLESNLLRYWSWLYAYLPTPLWGLALVAAVWGLARRTRLALLLLGCWAAFTMPTMLWSRGEMFQSRYVSQGIFPLLLLVAALMVASWDALWSRRRSRWQRLAALRPVGQLAASTLFLVLIGPTLWFDVQLLNRPESAPLPPTDRFLFVTSFDSGYGFKEAVQLVRQRAIELTRNGQPVIVLGNYYFGHTYDGLKIYLRGVPGVFQYVDSHMARDPEGFIAAWKSHRVPILLVGNDGLDRLDAFEKAVPRAKRLGFFPKPTGQSSFRVYEVDVADLGP